MSTITNANVIAFDKVEIEISCLAHNIYHEARGEPVKGQIAVGMVTMNRAKNNKFPSSVCGVVTQKVKNTCQFSWVCMKRLPKIKDEVYANIKELAEKIYFGDIKDITKGATFFHNNEVKPAWSETKQMTAVIGNHVFYRK